MSVSAAASAAYTISELASAALERICNAHRWQFAQVWHPDTISSTACSAPRFGEECSRVCRVSPRSARDTAIAMGEDLPGRVWDIKTANWFEEIGFAKLPRLRGRARDAGLKTALVFPVILGDEVLAVFEFFSSNKRRRTAPRSARSISSAGFSATSGCASARRRRCARARSAGARYSKRRRWAFRLTDHNLQVRGDQPGPANHAGLHRRGAAKAFAARPHRRRGARLPAAPRLAELREGKRDNYEVVTRFRRKDGTPIWVNTFVSTIPGNESSPPIYFATAIDITDRHRAESELRRTATYLAEAEKLSQPGAGRET